MITEKGFRFHIKGTVHVPQASARAGDVVAAAQAADTLRSQIGAQLKEIDLAHLITFETTDPESYSRRVEEPAPEPAEAKKPEPVEKEGKPK